MQLPCRQGTSMSLHLHGMMHYFSVRASLVVITCTSIGIRDDSAHLPGLRPSVLADNEPGGPLESRPLPVRIADLLGDSVRTTASIWESARVRERYRPTIQRILVA